MESACLIRVSLGSQSRSPSFSISQGLVSFCWCTSTSTSSSSQPSRALCLFVLHADIQYLSQRRRVRLVVFIIFLVTVRGSTHLEAVRTPPRPRSCPPSSSSAKPNRLESKLSPPPLGRKTLSLRCRLPIILPPSSSTPRNTTPASSATSPSALPTGQPTHCHLQRSPCAYSRASDHPAI